MSKKKQDNVYVSASDVSEAFFCSYRLENKVNGLSINKYNRKASKRGDKYHDHQNRLGVDRRCFVATYLYGGDDLRTDKLRCFRDIVLMPSYIGRVVVRIYYVMSPLLIFACKKSALMKGAFDRCISCFLSRL